MVGVEDQRDVIAVGERDITNFLARDDQVRLAIVHARTDVQRDAVGGKSDLGALGGRHPFVQLALQKIRDGHRLFPHRLVEHPVDGRRRGDARGRRLRHRPTAGCASEGVGECGIEADRTARNRLALRVYEVGCSARQEQGKRSASANAAKQGRQNRGGSESSKIRRCNTCCTQPRPGVLTQMYVPGLCPLSRLPTPTPRLAIDSDPNPGPHPLNAVPEQTASWSHTPTAPRRTQERPDLLRAESGPHRQWSSRNQCYFFGR